MQTRTRPHLHLSDGGSGEPLLLITGWTISAAVFEPVAGLYLPHARVVSYDHRGTGRSQRWLGPVSMAMLAADAARVLDDREISRAHVVGLSMGAAVALELAARMGHRVKSLVLIGGGAGGPATALPGMRDAAATAAAVLRDTASRRSLWPAAALFSKRFLHDHPERVNELMPYFGRGRASPWASAMQAAAAACFARAGSLADIGAPTLVLHGGEDVISPPDNARALARGIPGAELHLVPGAGHAVAVERPRATARLVLAWVRDHAALPAPQAPPRRQVISERLTRPLSLPAGALRNTAASVSQLAGAAGRASPDAASGPPRRRSACRRRS